MGGNVMLKSVRLCDFKSFEDSGDIQIKPITLLCGPNSSGKSSIFKSLLLLKQSFENNLSTNFATLNGSLTRNGDMPDVIRKNAGDSFTISSTFEIQNPKKQYTSLKDDVLNYKDLIKVIEGVSYKHAKPLPVNVNLQYTFTKYLDSNVLSRLAVDLIYNEHTMTIILVKNKDLSDRSYNLIVDGLKEKPLNITDCICYFEGLKVVSAYVNNPPRGKSISVYLDALKTITRCATGFYRTITHMSPLRGLPRRCYIDYDKNADDISVAATIQANLDTNLVTILPNQNKGKYNFIDALNEWSDYLGLGEIKYAQDGHYVSSITVNDSNIEDVGFGVSQVLPILVDGLLAEPGRTLLIEQPEIHLHPRMQMMLADFLIAMSNLGKILVVETHSDHIVNRIVRRCMEEKSGTLYKNIAFYYIDKTDGISNVYRDITVHPVNGLMNVPEGYFTQFSAEVMEIAKAGMVNYREGVTKW